MRQAGVISVRILRLYPFIPPCSGGLELHVSSLTREQLAMGHDVTLFFNQGQAIHPRNIKIASRFNLRTIQGQFKKDLLFYASAILYCVKDRFRCDVLHIHGDWAAFIFGVLLARIVRARTMVATIHEKTRDGLWRKLYRYVLSHYDVVYCTGFREAAQLRALGVSWTRWQPSGVSIEFVNISSSVTKDTETIDVICVSSLVQRKNIGLLIQVANQLPRTTFEVIGDGPLLGQLQDGVASLGLTNVLFRGHLDRTQLAVRLASAKVFYLPSLSEGTPTSMMEAMVQGLPVVVTPSNDYHKIVRQGINGFVTDDFSIASSVSAIELLLSREDLRQEIARRNRLDARHFLWPSVARRITEWMRPTAQ